MKILIATGGTGGVGGNALSFQGGNGSGNAGSNGGAGGEATGNDRCRRARFASTFSGTPPNVITDPWMWACVSAVSGQRRTA